MRHRNSYFSHKSHPHKINSLNAFLTPFKPFWPFKTINKSLILSRKKFHFLTLFLTTFPILETQTWNTAFIPQAVRIKMRV